METFRKILARAAIGLGIGFAASLMAGPSLISSLYAPLAGTVAMSCSGDVQSALDRFVRLQIWVGLVAAVVTPMVAWWIGRRFGKKPVAQEASAPAVSPQA